MFAAFIEREAAKEVRLLQSSQQAEYNHRSSSPLEEIVGDAISTIAGTFNNDSEYISNQSNEPSSNAPRIAKANFFKKAITTANSITGKTAAKTSEDLLEKEVEEDDQLLQPSLSKTSSIVGVIQREKEEEKGGASSGSNHLRIFKLMLGRTVLNVIKDERITRLFDQQVIQEHVLRKIITKKIVSLKVPEDQDMVLRLAKKSYKNKMEQQFLINALKNIDFFETNSYLLEQSNKLCNALNSVFASRSSVICHIGDTCSTFYIVIKGTVLGMAPKAKLFRRNTRKQTQLMFNNNSNTGGNGGSGNNTPSSGAARKFESRMSTIIADAQAAAASGVSNGGNSPRGSILSVAAQKTPKKLFNRETSKLLWDDMTRTVASQFPHLDVVQTYRAGDSFGQVFLLNPNAHSEMQFVCEENCELLTITKAEFDDLMGVQKSIVMGQKIEFLEGFDIFNNFSSITLLSLLELMTVETYEKNQPIFREGEDEAKHIYFIRSGEIKISFQYNRLMQSPPLLDSAHSPSSNTAASASANMTSSSTTGFNQAMLSTATPIASPRGIEQQNNNNSKAMNLMTTSMPLLSPNMMHSRNSPSKKSGARDDNIFSLRERGAFEEQKLFEPDERLASNRSGKRGNMTQSMNAASAAQSHQFNEQDQQYQQSPKNYESFDLLQRTLKNYKKNTRKNLDIVILHANSYFGEEDILSMKQFRNFTATCASLQAEVFKIEASRLIKLLKAQQNFSRMQRAYETKLSWYDRRRTELIRFNETQDATKITEISKIKENQLSSPHHHHHKLSGSAAVSTSASQSMMLRSSHYPSSSQSSLNLMQSQHQLQHQHELQLLLSKQPPITSKRLIMSSSLFPLSTMESSSSKSIRMPVQFPSHNESQMQHHQILNNNNNHNQMQQQDPLSLLTPAPLHKRVHTATSTSFLQQMDLINSPKPSEASFRNTFTASKNNNTASTPVSPDKAKNVNMSISNSILFEQSWWTPQIMLTGIGSRTTKEQLMQQLKRQLKQGTTLVGNSLSASPSPKNNKSKGSQKNNQKKKEIQNIIENNSIQTSMRSSNRRPSSVSGIQANPNQQSEVILSPQRERQQQNNSKGFLHLFPSTKEFPETTATSSMVSIMNSMNSIPFPPSASLPVFENQLKFPALDDNNHNLTIEDSAGMKDETNNFSIKSIPMERKMLNSSQSQKNINKNNNNNNNNASSINLSNQNINNIYKNNIINNSQNTKLINFSSRISNRQGKSSPNILLTVTSPQAETLHTTSGGRTTIAAATTILKSGSSSKITSTPGISMSSSMIDFDSFPPEKRSPSTTFAFTTPFSTGEVPKLVTDFANKPTVSPATAVLQSSKMKQKSMNKLEYFMNINNSMRKLSVAQSLQNSKSFKINQTAVFSMPKSKGVLQTEATTTTTTMVDYSSKNSYLLHPINNGSLTTITTPNQTVNVDKQPEMSIQKEPANNQLQSCNMNQIQAHNEKKFGMRLTNVLNLNKYITKSNKDKLLSFLAKPTNLNQSLI